MRIAVIGTGAVGGTIAALFDRAGHDVDVVARGENLDRIAADGLTLTGDLGDHVARVGAVSRLERRPELAVVATKASNAEDAMRPAARLLDGVPVVVVQNGLGALASGHRALPGSEIIGGLALFAASYLSPARVSVTTRGELYLGRHRDSTGLSALFAERTLGEILPVTVVDDFVGAQWTKLIVNQINALPAITGLSAQDVVRHPGLRLVLTASMREAVGVGVAAGVRFAPLQGLSHLRLRLFEKAPERLAQLLPLAMARRMGPVPNPGSTLQSIRRGQPTEIDQLNGAVVRAAEAAGVAAPINAGLVELVHAIEAGSGFLSADEVPVRLRAASS